MTAYFARMSFPPGKPVLVILLIAIGVGMTVVFRSSPARSDLVVWTFAESHANSFRTAGSDGTPALTDTFSRAHGPSVEVKLINNRALDVRLISLFNSNATGPRLPDLVEVEIGSVGKFFRPPVESVGFLPLNKFIERDGLRQQLVEARLTPWTKDGQVFGIPHDVHPVSLTYRKDLWEQAGVDLKTVRTWQEFHSAAKTYVAYWRGKTERPRYAIALPSVSADGVIQMLLQRGVNVVDADNTVRLTDPRVAKTLVFYATLIAGENRVATDVTPGGVNWTRDLASGDVGAMLTPDWSVTYLRRYAPTLTGKLGMIPLPRFDPTDAPTATWGGTMIGIPRNARDPEASWALLKHLYLTPQALEARQRFTDILPPVKSMWTDARYDAPDPLYDGQRTGRVFTELAAVVPGRTVTPFTHFGSAALLVLMNRSQRHLATHGEADLEKNIQHWLEEAKSDLERRIAFGEFE